MNRRGGPMPLYNYIIDTFGTILKILCYPFTQWLGWYSAAFPLLLFTLIIYVMLYPLIYMNAKRSLFKPLIEKESVSIRKECADASEELISEGKNEYSDEVVEMEIRRDRKIHKLYREHRVWEKSGISLIITKIVLFMFMLGMVMNLSSYLVRLGFIYDNLTALIPSYGYETEFDSVCGTRIDTDDVLTVRKALYSLSDGQWKELSSAMPKLSEIVDSIKTGSYETVGVFGESMSLSPVRQAKDGNFAGMLFPALAVAATALCDIPGIRKMRRKAAGPDRKKKMYSVIFTVFKYAVVFAVVIDFPVSVSIVYIASILLGFSFNLMARKRISRRYRSYLKA